MRAYGKEKERLADAVKRWLEVGESARSALEVVCVSARVCVRMCTSVRAYIRAQRRLFILLLLDNWCVVPCVVGCVVRCVVLCRQSLMARGFDCVVECVVRCVVGCVVDMFGHWGDRVGAFSGVSGQISAKFD